MDENNILPSQMDTSSFGNSIVPPTTHVDGLNQSSIPTTEVKITEFKNPQVVNYARAAQFDAQSQMMSFGKKNRDSIINSMFPNANKLDTTTTLDIRDTHEKMSNGTTWMPKYKSYLPGVDNDARLSAQQSATEKFLNPVNRLISNTAKAPLDIIGSVYGIGAAALSGRFDALYDNDYMHWLDDYTAETNFNNKNYYNEAESKQDLGLNLQTLDKVLGGAEFTTRLLAAEGILAVATGGASLPAAFAKTGLTGSAKIASIVNQGNKISKALKFIKAPEMMAASKAERTVGKSATWLKDALKAENITGIADRTQSGLRKAANRGQFGDLLVKTRFAVTSPLYEAGFESRHFQKEAEESFWNYYRQQGTEPTTEEINDFSDKLAGAADGVFAANMAILGPSNLAMMGNVLNLSNPFSRAITSSGKGVSERLFGMGVVKTADNTFTALKPTLTQKAVAYITPLVKSALTEGVYEEGGQGIASSTFKNYVASSYDPKYAQNTANYIDSFGQAFSDQFGTKEGREEMIIGGIIGALFGGMGAMRGSDSVANQYRKQERTAEVLNTGANFAENFKSNASTNEWLLSLFAQGNRFQNIQEQLSKAQQSGNKIEEASFQAQSFISMLDMYHSVGREETFMDTMSNVIQGLDSQMIADSTGLDISEINDYKKEQIQSMQDMSKNYGTALKAGRYIFGKNTAGTTDVDVNGKKVKVNGEMLSNALAFSTTMAGFNERFAMQSYDALQRKIAESTGGRELVEKMGAVMALKSMGQLELDQLYNLNGEIDKYRTQINEITDQIANLEKGEQRENSTAKRLKLSKELQIAQSNLTNVSEKAHTLFRASVDNFYGKMGQTGSATMPDLNTFTDQVKELNDSIENLRLSPSDKIIVDKLFEQFNQANESHKSFVNMAQNIQDVKFTPKTFKSLFGGLRAKWYEKSVNEHTQDTLAEIFEFAKPANMAKAKATSRFAPNTITEDKLEEGYKPTLTDLMTISNKLNNKKMLTPTEQTFYDNFKELIDAYNTQQQEDPLNSEGGIIDELYIQRVAKERELANLENGEYSPELQGKINKIRADITQLEADINGLTPDDSPITTELDQDIQDLEQEIQSLELSNTVEPEKVKNQKELRKENYTQYEYTTRKGEVLLGWVETRSNGKLFFTTENDAFYIGESKDTDLSKVENLKAIGEEDILIEGKEVYVNGKIYKLGLKNPTLDESISRDEDGNYQVKLQAGNGRMVTLKGSVADAIVYQNLLNKLEDEATAEQIRELNEQARRDSEIERKYEELVAKTEDRDSRISEINQERENLEQERQTKISDIQNEIQTLEDRIDNIAIEAEMEVRDELAELDGEISFQEKIDRLQAQAERLRERIAGKYDVVLENAKPNILTDAMGKKLTKLELEIARLQAEKLEEPFNPNATPSEQLGWIVNNIQDLNFENIDQASEFESPSAEDIQEYRDLIDTSNKNTAQNKRIAELREKLSPFIIAEGLSLDGINIIEVIELHNQSKKIQDKIDTQNAETSETELQQVVKKVDDKTQLNSEYRADNVGLVYDVAYVKKKNNGYVISHIRLESMLLASLEAGFNPVVTVYETDKKGNRTTVGEIPVTFDNMEDAARMFDNTPNIRVQLLSEVWLTKGAKDTAFTVNGGLNSFTDMMDLRVYAITGQPTDYVMFYDQKSDGTWGPKEAEYKVSVGGVEQLFNKEVLNGIKPGDTVNLEFDPSDDYNRTLTKKRYMDEANIYVRKNGELVQVLKASQFSTKKDSDLQAIRKKVIDNPNSSIKIKVSKSYLGLPIITLNADGTAKEIPVDEQQVIAYGYVNERGELKGDAAEVKNIDNDQYIGPLSTIGRKTPVVVFNNNGKNIVFPINVKPKGVDLTADVDRIMEQDVSQQRKMLEINSLLEQHDLLTKENALTTTDFDVSKVKNTLQQVYDSIDVTDMNQIKDADKTSFVDLNDAFHSAKLVFDFGNITEDVIEDVGKATREIVKTRVKTKNNKGIETIIDKVC